MKDIYIPVPHEFAAKVKEIIPAEAIEPTRHKDRWAFVIKWRSHQDKSVLTNTLKRHGLRLRKKLEYGRDRGDHDHGVWGCCCDCAGCYLPVKGYFVVDKIRN
jgi:hypothetical protein